MMLSVLKSVWRYPIRNPLPKISRTASGYNNILSKQALRAHLLLACRIYTSLQILIKTSCAIFFRYAWRGNRIRLCCSEDEGQNVHDLDRVKQEPVGGGQVEKEHTEGEKGQTGERKFRKNMLRKEDLRLVLLSIMLVEPSFVVMGEGEWCSHKI